MRRTFAILSLASLVGVAVVTSGCGPQCGGSNQCFVDGQPPNLLVCDGHSWQSCDDGHRGLVIKCYLRNEQAVCSPDGWSFQPNGPAVDGGS